ncbi:MAG TPA: homoserine kinase [Pyrinomonadaceae bacterium]|nr:homoserine kinase [Pyrinomonadaceae bacterium]
MPEAMIELVSADTSLAAEDEMEMPRGRLARHNSVEVRVPASTSNLGAGFDCFGLALKLYLTVRATLLPGAADLCRVRSRGEESSTKLPRTAENLVYRAMSFAAEREGAVLPPVRLAVHNEIPLGRGLGSSAAAIVAGLKIFGHVCGNQLSDDILLRYAAEMEGHADNVSASLCGGWIVTCVKDDGEVIAIRRPWPADVKVVVVSPQVSLNTSHARAALPATVEHRDAAHNLQRAALFGAALSENRYDLLWESMRDRLHQRFREGLVPGLGEALETPRLPGLLGVALSGAGPSVIALAESHFEEIGEKIAGSFRRQHVEAKVRLLEVDDDGLMFRERPRDRK